MSHLSESTVGWDRQTGRRKKKESYRAKNSLLIGILTPLLPAPFPFESLFRNTSMRVQTAEGASAGEQQQKQVKWNILHYHQGSPLRLKSSSSTSFNRLCTTTASAPLRTCTHTHARAKKKQNSEKKGEETRFGMSLSVFYSDIILLCSPSFHSREQPGCSNNQSVMWHFAEAFILHDSC